MFMLKLLYTLTFKPHVWGKSEVDLAFLKTYLLSPMYGANVTDYAYLTISVLLSPMYGANFRPVDFHTSNMLLSPMYGANSLARAKYKLEQLLSPMYGANTMSILFG